MLRIAEKRILIGFLLLFCDELLDIGRSNLQNINCKDNQKYRPLQEKEDRDCFLEIKGRKLLDSFVVVLSRKD